MVCWIIVRKIFVRAFFVFSRIIANLVLLHLLIEEYFHSRMPIIHKIRWQMWYNVSIMHHSLMLFYFGIYELSKVLISNSWTSKVVNNDLSLVTIFQSKLDSIYWRKGCSQTMACTNYFFHLIFVQNLLSFFYQFLWKWQIILMKANMNITSSATIWL